MGAGPHEGGDVVHRYSSSDFLSWAMRGSILFYTIPKKDELVNSEYASSITAL